VYIADTHHLPIIKLDNLGEVQYGKWEGKKIKRLAKKKSWHAVQHYPSRFQFPAGEALREAQFRAIQTIEGLSKSHKKEMIVVVSHADVIKMTLAHYLGVHLDLFQRIVVSPASISVLALQKNGVVRIVRMNDTGPLSPPTTPAQDEEE
jgi:probable phosphoglycerate mutase